MAKKFKVHTKENIGSRIIGPIARFFKKRPEIVNLSGGELPEVCIMIGNHNGAGGAFNYRTYLKNRFMTWGAHQMCEGYISRFRYLKNVFYGRKLKYGKVRSFFCALLFALVSRIIYASAGMIPVYYDMRVYSTMKYSMECLKKDVAVFIFPEDSGDGYLEKPARLHSGFVQLSRLYHKMRGVDIPVYTILYQRKPKRIIIGKPMYVQELMKTHTVEETCDIFRQYMNGLDALQQ